MIFNLQKEGPFLFVKSSYRHKTIEKHTSKDNNNQHYVLEVCKQMVVEELTNPYNF